MSKVVNNYESIKKTKEKMITKIEELYKNLLIVESKIDRTKFDFDTPLANRFRLKANELINKEIMIST